ncbi:MAG: S8 family peptidase [Opitutales bacterium]
MNRFRIFAICFAVLVFGAAIGWWIYHGQERKAERDEGTEAVDQSAEEKREADFETSEEPQAMVPPNAIEGERVIHFPTRGDFRDYLRALSEHDMRSLGQIEELLVVRVRQETFEKGPDPNRFGAYSDFAYRVERPPEPDGIDGGALGHLQAFNESARTITGEDVAGDGSGVLVGILDSGIQAHPQFDDVYIVHMDLPGGGVDGPGAAHGTSVASIITGSEGVAPNAELLVVRVLDDEGIGNSFHVAEGIVQAAKLGVDVMNFSVGLYEDTHLLQEAVRYAKKQDVAMVAAAGNDGYRELPFPAAYPDVLAVTAVDARGEHAVFPNRSEAIDFAVPGVGIMTAKNDTGTALFSGTSASAPFVTGTLARLLSGEKERSPDEAVEFMKQHLNEAGAPGKDPLYGEGVLDWDRIRERDVPHLLDVALADIYLDPEAVPGTTEPVQVIVENRGTKWFSNAELEVLRSSGEPERFVLETLGPGQTATRKVYIELPSPDGGGSFEVGARVMPEEPEKTFDRRTI